MERNEWAGEAVRGLRGECGCVVRPTTTNERAKTRCPEHRAQQTDSIHTSVPETWNLGGVSASPGAVSTKKVPAFSVPMTVFLMKWEKYSMQRDSTIVSAVQRSLFALSGSLGAGL